jgi:hypothetical protein
MFAGIAGAPLLVPNSMPAQSNWIEFISFMATGGCVLAADDGNSIKSATTVANNGPTTNFVLKFMLFFASFIL